MLNQDERNWLNHYHHEVSEKIGPNVSAAAQAWLKNATATI